MSDILEKILAVKREEVAAALAQKPLAALRAEAESRSPPNSTSPCKSRPASILTDGVDGVILRIIQ